MLKVWEEYVTWMRHYMVSAVANLPDKEFVAERLMRNQEDIGSPESQASFRRKPPSAGEKQPAARERV
jgi:hypothetical protein